MGRILRKLHAVLADLRAARLALGGGNVSWDAEELSAILNEDVSELVWTSTSTGDVVQATVSVHISVSVSELIQF